MKKKLIFEEKNNLCNQGSVNTAYQKQSELVEHHSVLQFLGVKKIMSNINTKKSTKF